MGKISYAQPDGSVSIVDAAPGTSVMRAALRAGVPGIVGTCGGQAMCASCHVYLLRSSADLADPEEEEEDMLECVVAERRPGTSRLSCQLTIQEDGDEIEVEIPDRQV